MDHLGYILGKSHNVYMRVYGCDSKHQISVDKLHWVKHVMFVYDRLNQDFVLFMSLLLPLVT